MTISKMVLSWIKIYFGYKMENWQNKILETHYGQTGFFKEIEMEQTNPQNFGAGDPVEVKKDKYNSFGLIIEVDEHLQECKVHCIDTKWAWYKFSELQHMQDPECEIECENCDEGKEEYFAGCGKPAWDCCGGCYAYRECEECNGSGMITKNIDEIILNFAILKS